MSSSTGECLFSPEPRLTWSLWNSVFDFGNRDIGIKTESLTRTPSRGCSQKQFLWISRNSDVISILPNKNGSPQVSGSLVPRGWIIKQCYHMVITCYSRKGFYDKLLLWSSSAINVKYRLCMCQEKWLQRIPWSSRL